MWVFFFVVLFFCYVFERMFEILKSHIVIRPTVGLERMVDLGFAILACKDVSPLFIKFVSNTSTFKIAMPQLKNFFLYSFETMILIYLPKPIRWETFSTWGHTPTSRSNSQRSWGKKSIIRNFSVFPDSELSHDGFPGLEGLGNNIG